MAKDEVFTTRALTCPFINKGRTLQTTSNETLTTGDGETGVGAHTILAWIQLMALLHHLIRREAAARLREGLCESHECPAKLSDRRCCHVEKKSCPSDYTKQGCATIHVGIVPPFCEEQFPLVLFTHTKIEQSQDSVLD